MPIEATDLLAPDERCRDLERRRWKPVYNTPRAHTFTQALSVRRPETQEDTGFCQRSSRQRGTRDRVHVFLFWTISRAPLLARWNRYCELRWPEEYESWNFRAEKSFEIFFLIYFFPPFVYKCISHLCKTEFFFLTFKLFLKNWMENYMAEVWKFKYDMDNGVSFPRLSSKMPFSHNVNYTNYVNVGIRRFSYNQPLFIFA